MPRQLHGLRPRTHEPCRRLPNLCTCLRSSGTYHPPVSAAMCFDIDILPLQILLDCPARQVRRSHDARSAYRFFMSSPKKFCLRIGHWFLHRTTLGRRLGCRRYLQSQLPNHQPCVLRTWLIQDRIRCVRLVHRQNSVHPIAQKHQFFNDIVILDFVDEMSLSLMTQAKR